MRLAQLPDDRFPAISDLKRKAKQRIPFIGWEYLDSATGREEAADRNEQALSNVILVPCTMKGEMEVDITTELFGKKWSAPFGIAPIGLASLMWPGAEQILAKTAAKNMIPHCLSTVAADKPEICGPLADGNGWFQLYAPRRPDIRTDLLKRAFDNGYHTLVVTADVPAPSMRERQRRAGISMPPKTTPKMIVDMLMCPAWLKGTIKRGRPRFLTLEKYVDRKQMEDLVHFVSTELGGVLDWAYLDQLRKEWKGNLVLKGILSAKDAKQAVKAGVDGVWVSNHGGRQFDAAPASLDVLPQIAGAVGKDVKILFDSGVRSGLDVLRAIALGADFVFLGRPFIYGLGALGDKGGDHVYELIACDLANNLIQLGVEKPTDARKVDLRHTS